MATKATGKKAAKTVQPLKVKKADADKVKGGLMRGPEE